jgi:hypothetical protein
MTNYSFLKPGLLQRQNQRLTYLLFLPEDRSNILLSILEVSTIDEVTKTRTMHYPALDLTFIFPSTWSNEDTNDFQGMMDIIGTQVTKYIPEIYYTYTSLEIAGDEINYYLEKRELPVYLQRNNIEHLFRKAVLHRRSK